MSCPSPHPTRAADWRDELEDVETVGSYPPDSWVRCRKCGKWFWLITDLDSKWQYFDEWELDPALAKRALVDHDTGAVAELFVSNDLPWGPVWTASTALVEILRALTPSATDAERRRALDAAIAKGQPALRGSSGDNRWLAARKLLDELATQDVPTAPDLPFALDVTLEGRTFEDDHEIQSSLVLFQKAPSPAVVRIDAKAISESPVAGPMRFITRDESGVLFGVATAEGESVCRIDAAGVISTLAPTKTRYTVRDLDDGWWLFVPDDSTPIRYVEFHHPDARPKVKMRMACDPESSHVCPPRRMGDGWIVSGCVDDEDVEQALTLFDASFKTIAQSRDARGQRMVTPIDADSLWCETARYPFVVERWERRGALLERTFDMESQSWTRVKGGVVIKPRKVDGGLLGYDDTGKQRFSLDMPTRGQTYFADVREGLLVYNDSRAETLDPATGVTVAPTLEIEAASLFAGRDGTVYLHDRASLWVLGQERKRIFIGQGPHLETTCGNDALLRDDRGECLLACNDGSLRGRFSAPGARFSVVGTRGGPYVVEGSRVRVASFG